MWSSLLGAFRGPHNLKVKIGHSTIHFHELCWFSGRVIFRISHAQSASCFLLLQVIGKQRLTPIGASDARSLAITLSQKQENSTLEETQAHCTSQSAIKGSSSVFLSPVSPVAGSRFLAASLRFCFVCCRQRCKRMPASRGSPEITFSQPAKPSHKASPSRSCYAFLFVPLFEACCDCCGTTSCAISTRKPGPPQPLSR